MPVNQDSTLIAQKHCNASLAKLPSVIFVFPVIPPNVTPVPLEQLLTPSVSDAHAELDTSSTALLVNNVLTNVRLVHLLMELVSHVLTLPEETKVKTVPVSLDSSIVEMPTVHHVLQHV